MSKEAIIIECNQSNFGQYVLLNSQKIIVVVEFMNVWSGPCSVMDAAITALAKEFPGQFMFVKIDADEQPELCKEYKVLNTPTLMVFKDGEAARIDVGELKEPEIRLILKGFGIFNPSDLLREKAREQHIAGNSAAAITSLTDAIKLDSSNIRVVMDMVQIFIDIGEIEQASGLYERLPSAVHSTEMGKALNGQLTFSKLASQTEDMSLLQERVSNDEHDSSSRFDLAICLIAKYQIDEAITHLFYILTNDAEYKEGAAKEMIVTVVNMIEPVDNDLAQNIRRKLASVLVD